MPIQVKPKIFNEEAIDIVIEKVINNEDLQKSGTEIETYKNVEEIKHP